MALHKLKDYALFRLNEDYLLCSFQKGTRTEFKLLCAKGVR